MLKRIFCGLTAALAALCVGGVSTGVAQELGVTKLSSYSALQDRLTEVESRLASFNGGGGGGGAGDCGCVGGCSHCTTPGFTVDGELMFLRAYSGDEGQSPSTQYIATPRVTAGFVRADGLGLRVRAFIYDSESSIEHFDVSFGDIEVTDKFELGCWSGVLSGGLRGAHYKESASNDIDFTGFGPVIGASLTRPLQGNLHLVGSARYSVVFGRDSVFNERETNTITEVSLGTEYRRSVCGTNELFLRSAWETQYWAQVADADEGDFGLVGYSFAIGITR